MITYELALNERTRRFLRVQEVFHKFDAQINNMGKFSEHACFTTLFDVMSCASRSDLKIEIIQELDKQILSFIKKNKTSKNIKKSLELKKIKKSLEKSNIPTGHHFGNDKFLQELKAASDSPFGIVSSDITQFQSWIKQLETKEKKDYFRRKFKVYTPIYHGLNAIIDILKSSAQSVSHVTKSGVLQHALDPKLKNDLVLVTLPVKGRFCPQITSNKYALNIHFTQNNESIMIAKPIKFKLSVCSL